MARAKPASIPLMPAGKPKSPLRRRKRGSRCRVRWRHGSRPYSRCRRRRECPLILPIGSRRRRSRRLMRLRRRGQSRSSRQIDPYEPLGIRAGAFILRPAIDLSTGYDSNPGRDSTPKGSPFYIVAPELQATSDWQRHEFRAKIRGSYDGYTEQPSLNRPYFESILDGRIDVTTPDPGRTAEPLSRLQPIRLAVRISWPMLPSPRFTPISAALPACSIVSTGWKSAARPASTAHATKIPS